MGLMPVLKRHQRAHSPSSHHVRIQEGGSSQPGGAPSPELDPIGSLVSDFQPPELREINFWCL